MKRHTAVRLLGVGALATTAALTLAACGQGFDDGGGSDASDDLTSSDDALTVMIGSSGEAETAAVEEAIAAWSAESGVDAEVLAATNLSQELAQGFAAGSPPDLFYLSTDQLAGFVDNGSVRAYGDLLDNKDDFYPSLVSNFTVDGEFVCAPKDFSTLALVINTTLWEAAGLTDADIPTTWDELASVAQTLTTDGRVGLAFGAEYQRLGAFMAQAGGRLVSADGTEAVADSPENVEALTYVKDHLADGTFAFAADIGAGWGGEAFGKELAAMVVEGNWITGGLAADFPDVEYTVAQLPEGPAGPGTMQFTNCWGMASDSPNQEAVLDLVEYLTSTDQQLAFSEAFGPMPSIESAAADWEAANPELAAFLAGSDYAIGMPTNIGITEVITDFNAQLESLATGDPQQMLESVQTNLEAVVGG
ncbi:extracellular solute-binding protein [Microbacterium sp. NPDC058021]|uniref:extracellular solute-binding protein n=1 Tax=Microbacterium sp. NPDC058021 TaxID=3346306 RepID=UPI0036DB4E51